MVGALSEGLAALQIIGGSRNFERESEGDGEGGWKAMYQSRRTLSQRRIMNRTRFMLEKATYAWFPALRFRSSVSVIRVRTAVS